MRKSSSRKLRYAIYYTLYRMDAQTRTRNIVVPAKPVNNRTLENKHKNIRISEWGVSPHAVISSLGAMGGSLVAGKSSVSSSRDQGQARARPDHRFCCFFFALLCFWFCFLFAIMCCVIYVAFLYICYYFWFYVCVIFCVFLRNLIEVFIDFPGFGEDSMRVRNFG